MTINEAIEYLEDCLPEDLENMKPLERARFLADLWEYKNPKLQRNTFNPEQLEEGNVQITVNGNSSNPSLSATLDNPEKGKSS